MKKKKQVLKTFPQSQNLSTENLKQKNNQAFKKTINRHIKKKKNIFFIYFSFIFPHFFILEIKWVCSF